jgi:DNA-binding HTH domain-containing proteins
MHQSAVAQLLGRLYGSDLGEQGFVPFLNEIGRAMHSHVVSLQGHDLEHQCGRIDVGVGLTPEWLDLFERSASEHPWFLRGGGLLLAHGIADDEGLTTDAELRGTRFYADVLQPVDISHGMALCLNTGPRSQISVLTINRDQHHGYFKPDERHLAQALLPHLRNVYTLHQRLSWLQTGAQSFRAALDHMDEGVLLLAGNGTVLFANEQAQSIEADGVFMRCRHNTIVAVWHADEAPLHEALSRALLTPTVGRVSLGLHDHHGRLAGSITLCPTLRMTANLWSESSAVVMVFVRQLAPSSAPDITTLRSILRLTMAESRLASTLMQGASLDEAATLLGVTRNTVRTQLRNLFAKTDTHRQSELLRVLLSVGSRVMR